jgi:hypothetical protein
LSWISGIGMGGALVATSRSASEKQRPTNYEGDPGSAEWQEGLLRLVEEGTDRL